MPKRKGDEPSDPQLLRRSKRLRAGPSSANDKLRLAKRKLGSEKSDCSKRVCARLSNASSNNQKFLLANGENKEFKALHLAISQNLPIRQIRLAIKNCLPYIDRCTGSGTPLIMAIKKGDVQLLKCLIKTGCSLETCCAKRTTPLQYAIRKRNLKIIKILIANGVDRTRKGSLGMTPLIEAIKSQSIEIIDLIIGSGIDLNAAKWDGETALIWAVKIGLLPIVKLLITKGAALDVSDLKHRTALHHALLPDNPSEDIAQYLINIGANFHLKDDKGRYPLDYAVRGDLETLVRSLIEKGANCHDYDYKQKGLLHHAALKSEGLFSFLLEQNLDISKIDSKGRTPLHIAATAKYPDTAEKLVEKGADIMAKDFRGRQPLHCAIQLKRRSCIELLVKNEAGVTAVDIEGRTPLHYALSYLTSCSFRSSIFELLVERVTNLDSLTCLDTDNQTLLSHALEIVDQEIFLCLIRKGANVNVSNSDGLTPLHLAIKRRQFWAIDYLVAEANDLLIDMSDNEGKSALDYAIFDLAAEGNDLLIDMSDNEGKSAQDYAIFDKECSMTAIQKLLQAGASRTHLTQKQRNEIEHILSLEYDS